MIHRAPTAVLLSCLLVLIANASADQKRKEKPKKEKTKEPAVVWTKLFDGKSFKQWEILKKDGFEKHGKVHVRDGAMVLGAGEPATGVRWTGKGFPTQEYELSWEAKRVEGGDFFSAVTFPVGKGSLTLIIGGWGGQVVGLSCIDGAYAIDNDTVSGFPFKEKQWYRFRVRVKKKSIAAWIGDKQVVDFEIEQQKLSASDEMKSCLPLGVATWRTKGAVRKLQFRRLTKEKEKEQKKP